MMSTSVLLKGARKGFAGRLARSSRAKPAVGRRPPAVLAALRLLACAAAGSATALLAWFPGHWLIALLALPVLWARAERRYSATAVWVGYYLMGARDIPIVTERFFSGHGELSHSTAFDLGVLFWLAQCFLLATPWTVAKAAKGRRGHSWRAVAATVATCVPPVGIIGWLSPLHVASVLFPGWQSASLLLGFLAIAVAASAPVRTALLTPPLVGLVLLAHIEEPRPLAPAGWAVVNSSFGKLDQSTYGALFDRSQKAIGAAESALAGNKQVVVLPEEIVGPWSPAVRFWWHPFLAKLVQSQQTVVLGVDLASAAEDIVDPGHNDYFRYTDSAIARGAGRGRFDSRQPVPGGLWRPGARVSARRGGVDQGYASVSGTAVGFSICYEDYLLWPHWRLFVRPPDVLVSMANDWFARDLALGEIQRQSIESVARMAGLPLLRAVNR